jgi:hypothetical protein
MDDDKPDIADISHSVAIPAGDVQIQTIPNGKIPDSPESAFLTSGGAQCLAGALFPAHFSPQTFHKRLGILQVRQVKTLCELAID